MRRHWIIHSILTERGHYPSARQGEKAAPEPIPACADDYITAQNINVELLSTQVNGGEAKVYGLEAAYNQVFDFLPAPFDGLGLTRRYLTRSTPRSAPCFRAIASSHRMKDCLALWTT